MIKRLVITTSVAVGVLFGGASFAADLAAGKAAYERLNCASCHGADGAKVISPTYPILAGQHADYLRHALTSYKRGAQGAPATANIRKNALMGAFASQMSRQDIVNVSAWLAEQPSPLTIKK
jgi:cytochrome c553